MAVKKYNHYVPKFYLANFSGNTNFISKCLIQSKKIILSSSIKSTGGKDYLYGEDSTVEDYFCELEGAWAHIIRNILHEGCLPDNSEDLEALLFCIVLSEARTLARAKENQSLYTNLYRNIFSWHTVHGCLRNSELTDKFTPDCISVDFRKSNMPDICNAPFIVDSCNDLSLNLIENNSTTGFITSDRPVVRYNQFFMDCGYNISYQYTHMGIQVYMPISPKYCLLLYDPIPYNTHCHNGEKFLVDSPVEIMKINSLLAGYADQEIYFNNLQTTSNDIIKLLSDRPSQPLSKSLSSISFFYSSYHRNISLPLLTTKDKFLESSISHPVTEFFSSRLNRPII